MKRTLSDDEGPGAVEDAESEKKRLAADLQIELGDEIAIPHDWQTRGTYLTTEFECFERDHVRFFHHVNGLFTLFLAQSHPLYSHPLKASAKLVYGEEALRCLIVEGKKRKGAPRAEVKWTFASIQLDDGTSYELKCGIKGFIVEVNESLIADCSPLLNPDNEMTYLVILQPKSDFKSMASFKPGMMEEAKERRDKRTQRQQQQRQEKEDKLGEK